jgi:hypothetical protein
MLGRYAVTGKGGNMSCHNLRTVCLTAVLVVILVASSSATKLAGEFLATGFGAKALGMGGAFVSIADDASAVYWNPAGLYQLDRRQALLMHSQRFGGLVDYSTFSFAMPLSREAQAEAAGAIGLVWLRVSDIALTSHLNTPGVDFIDERDPDTGQPNGKWDPGERRLWDPDRVRWESDHEIAGFLSYSRKISESTALGFNAKLIWKELAEISALGFGLDAAVLHTVMPNWNVGVTLQDVTTTPLYWDGWYYDADTPDGKYKVSTTETINPTLKVGTSYRLPVAAIAGDVVLAVDTDFKFEGLDEEEADFSFSEVSGDVRLGAIYEYKRVLRVALGMDRRKPSAGIGLTAAGFNLDYAFWRDTELDNTHRISVSMDF